MGPGVLKIYRWGASERSFRSLDGHIFNIYLPLAIFHITGSCFIRFHDGHQVYCVYFLYVVYPLMDLLHP